MKFVWKLVDLKRIKWGSLDSEWQIPHSLTNVLILASCIWMGLRGYKLRKRPWEIRVLEKEVWEGKRIQVIWKYEEAWGVLESQCREKGRKIGTGKGKISQNNGYQNATKKKPVIPPFIYSSLKYYILTVIFSPFPFSSFTSPFSRSKPHTSPKKRTSLLQAINQI